MSKVLIAGIGNALPGDDGVGPFAIKVLESQYEFPDNVEVADLANSSRISRRSAAAFLMTVFL